MYALTLCTQHMKKINDDKEVTVVRCRVVSSMLSSARNANAIDTKQKAEYYLCYLIFGKDGASAENDALEMLLYPYTC